MIYSNVEQLDEAAYRYPNTSYENLLKFGALQLGSSNLGFQYGKVFDLSAWGLLGHIMAVLPTKRLNIPRLSEANVLLKR